jgi:GTP-binding protein HflX
MAEPILLSEPAVERAFLVGIQQGRTTSWDAAEAMDELAQLCETAGAAVVEKLICRLARPNPAMYIGSGKAQEIAERIKELGIHVVVFDEDLTPVQGRNLEKALGVKVVDRTEVILDIFAQHARTREGRMQIELAQLEYQLPRLRRLWTHLERQKGGGGFVGGPGERQIELDRRRIEQRIVRCRRDLNDVRGRRAELRRGRRRHGWALISLVGYTNAGKSTLLNHLTGAEVLAYDKLFATLDPTTRQLKLPNHQPALLTDTVGFIRKLPHHLVESFKATLEEVIEADLLVHVINAAHPLVDDQIKAVNTVLKELGVEDKPVLSVLNQIDRPESEANVRRLLEVLQPSVAVSARTGDGLDRLRDVLADTVRHRSTRVRLRIPVRESRLLASLRASASVHREKYEEDVAVIEASLPDRLLGPCEAYIQKGRTSRGKS